MASALCASNLPPSSVSDGEAEKAPLETIVEHGVSDCHQRVPLGSSPGAADLAVADRAYKRAS